MPRDKTRDIARQRLIAKYRKEYSAYYKEEKSKFILPKVSEDRYLYYKYIARAVALARTRLTNAHKDEFRIMQWDVRKEKNETTP